MFHSNYNGDLSDMPPPGLVPELLACRACLATDTKLYNLGGVVKDTYEYLMGTQLTTTLVRTVDRVSHKLLLKFTLGIDTNIIHIVGDDGDKKEKCATREEPDKPIHTPMNGTDGLTDVLNDFEEITKNIDDDIELGNNEFDDINGSLFIDRAKNFNVDELFRGKTMNPDLNEISGKSVNNDIGDIIYRAFKGKGKGKSPVTKAMDNESAIKKVINEDTNSTIPDAEEVLNANLNDNFTPDITLNDVSINTNDLNDTDSNLVDTFNNFILDHDYLDEKFLLDTGDPEFIKKNAISKKTEEDSLLREIVPKMTKKDKKLMFKEIETTAKKKFRKPVKDLSKLKEINKRDKKIKTDETIDQFKLNQLTNIKVEDDSKIKPIITKPELPTDDKIKSELSKEFIKFGSDFKFRVFEQSREEQLEELQKKREGMLFVSALYKCEDCAKGFRSVVTYSNHMRVHDPSYGPFECGICRSRHKTEPRRRRHQDTHRLQYCCTQCQFVARSREKAESHFEWHAGKTYECEHCGAVFGKASTHLSHVRLHHPSACVWCALCGEAFVGARGLRMHTRRRHPAVTVCEPAERVCSACRVQFGSPGALGRHRAAGCRADLRPCTECGESFESEDAMLQHRRGSHSDVSALGVASELSVPPAARPRGAPAPPRTPRERRAMCELCGKKYHSAAALSYHQRSHTGARPHACPRCPRAFALDHSLQAHLRTHTGERPYRCSQCSRAFRNANNLARHKKTVHLGQRQYTRCALCLKWFSSASAARLHVACVHHRRPWPRRTKPGNIDKKGL